MKRSGLLLSMPYALCIMLFALCSLLFAHGEAGAALRIGNSGTGRGGTYSAPQGGEVAAQQQAEMQALIETAQTSTELGLPVRVANMDMARAIAGGQSYNGIYMANLEACAAIFPNGAFAWDSANVGVRNSSGCVADVELRYMQGTEDIVLARARVAAGNSIDCNISAFPEESYTAEAGKIMFPADREPTEEEVKKVMNDEQKQGAGMRIAAAALIGGLGGNFLGRNEPGKSGALGTSEDKLKMTAIGALAMGGATAASTQAGKVGGDVIMSATVNAVGGGLIGNMSGIGKNSVLLIRKCDDGKDCLYGTIGKSETLDSKTVGGVTITEVGFLNGQGTMMKCTQSTDAESEVAYDNCTPARFTSYKLGTFDNWSSKPDDIVRAMESSTEKHCYSSGQMKNGSDCEAEAIFYKLSDVSIAGKQEAAVIVGWDPKENKTEDFKKYRNGSNHSLTIKLRHQDGTIGKESELTVKDFTEMTQSADDGAIIDIHNQARTKATATGAGAGAALGGFSAYQGAKDEISSRWAAEKTAYLDSLTKFYCATGKRFLGNYNETAIIPNEK